MPDIIRIEPGSEAWDKLAEMMARPGDPRAISLSVLRRGTSGGLQLKWGGGTWTTPLSTSDPSKDRGKACNDPDCGCS